MQRFAAVMLQRLVPLAPGRQQVTAAGLPQVERDAHFLAAFRHAADSRLVSSRFFVTSPAQST